MLQQLHSEKVQPHFSKDLNFRQEGDHLFLANSAVRSFMWLTGDASKLVLDCIKDPTLLVELREQDENLYASLLYCRIVLGDANFKKLEDFHETDRKQLTGYRPSAGAIFGPLRILWEVTRACNKKCIYCHAPAKPVVKTHGKLRLDHNELLSIAQALADARVMEVTLSGGEAIMLGEDLFDIIKLLRSNNIATSLISNGALVTSDLVKRLQSYDVSVAISLDVHRADLQALTRGKDAFNHAVTALNLLEKHGIRRSVISTVTRYNADYFDDLIAFCHGLNIETMTFQNLIPTDDLDLFEALRLTKAQEEQLIKTVPALLRKWREMNIQFTEVDFFSRLQYGDDQFEQGEYIQDPDNHLMSRSCSACHTGAFIDYNGDMFPCTSMRMLKMGNLLTQSMQEMWMLSEASQFVRAIRSKTVADLPACKDCSYIDHCSGGCRGEAFTMFGDWQALHARCPRRIATAISKE
ncbi:radical SAM/SPASM domain-containing protein [uncultured Cohaesibacter sp.]|uniref:radical SAM/SPASM domain-containing protein n=1 Tax=uncultured Cohaesibacter sp. TaxID=1002546 RepID=UPI0029C95F3C|nr:radical SAM protein [uncultured Cohaesibacter sp.]